MKLRKGKILFRTEVDLAGKVNQIVLVNRFDCDGKRYWNAKNETGELVVLWEEDIHSNYEGK